MIIMLTLGTFCISVIFLCNEAFESLKFIPRKRAYEEIAAECEDEGGALLMKGEQLFNDLATQDVIPASQEFWVGDLLFTDWVLPIDCTPKNSLNVVNQTPMITNELFQCYRNCIGHNFLALKNNYCVCIDNYRVSNYQQLSPCNVFCSDIGLCGGGNQTEYVNIYEVADSVDSRTENPSAIGGPYIECLTARCPVNDYVGVSCDSQSQNYGLCGTTDLTSSSMSYNAALRACADTTRSYFNGECFNKTDNKVWTGLVRSTFSPLDGIIPGLLLARGAKCTKFPNSYGYTVNCIPAIEATPLPFVCKMGYPQSYTTSTPTNQGTTKAQSRDGNDSTTGIVVGCVLGGTAVCVIVIVVVCLRKRRQNSRTEFPAASKPVEHHNTHHVYELPQTGDEPYDHVYADTTEVYHPYLEIRDGTSSIKSGGYGQNMVRHTAPQTGEIGVLSRDPVNSVGINLAVNSGYEEPKRTPNFGRKLPQVPSEHN